MPLTPPPPSSSRFAKYAERYRNTLRLLLSCPDRPGLVAAVSRFFFERSANITDLQEYCTSAQDGLLYMRVEAEVPDLAVAASSLQIEFAAMARTLAMDWRFTRPAQLKRLAIFVSRQDHCLMELLYHWRSGDLVAEIPCVISNHDDCRRTVEAIGIPFHLLDVTPETKHETERRQMELLESHRVDVAILARYMQILSPEFVRQYHQRIINIHHSFLPAFVGGNPYQRAYDRGVKLIGATAHYVTEQLDEGPIIEQDVERVTHRDRPEELRRIGRDIERTVLARAVNWHLQDRILVHGNKTVIFN